MFGQCNRMLACIYRTFSKESYADVKTLDDNFEPPYPLVVTSARVNSAIKSQKSIFLRLISLALNILIGEVAKRLNQDL